MPSERRNSIFDEGVPGTREFARKGWRGVAGWGTAALWIYAFEGVWTMLFLSIFLCGFSFGRTQFGADRDAV